MSTILGTNTTKSIVSSPTDKMYHNEKEIQSYINTRKDKENVEIIRLSDQNHFVVVKISKVVKINES